MELEKQKLSEVIDYLRILNRHFTYNCPNTEINRNKQNKITEVYGFLLDLYWHTNWDQKEAQ